MTVQANQKTVLIGVTGCIAAYKSCEIIRQFQKRGIRVKVVMTPHATEFVGPTTFRALTNEPVAIKLFDEPGAPIHHVSLAQECDLFLIAPCTGNVVAKIAHGIADDLLTTTALACPAPLMIAPAMNVNMYNAAATQDNFEILRKRGVHIVEADEGYLACGDTGKGRLADPQVIVEAAMNVLQKEQDLAGKKVMITAGPTQEAIDSVRFISNYSSGKMGYALAKCAVARGAEVTLVSGPVSLAAPEGVTVVPVTTACEMLKAARDPFMDADIAVFTAAVADFRPADPANYKLKKGNDDEKLESIRLIENPDILATLALQKRANQVVIGFAAETNDVVENAQSKLAYKGADMIVANEVGKGKAFGTDDNQAFLVTSDAVDALPMMPKDQLADVIFDATLKL